VHKTTQSEQNISNANAHDKSFVGLDLNLSVSGVQNNKLLHIISYTTCCGLSTFENANGSILAQNPNSSPYFTTPHSETLKSLIIPTKTFPVTINQKVLPPKLCTHFLFLQFRIYACAIIKSLKS